MALTGLCRVRLPDKHFLQEDVLISDLEFFMTEDELRSFVRDENAAARQRHEHHRERRRKATLAGLHLPNVTEIATGFPFLSGRLAADAQAYAERLLPRLRKGPRTLVEALAAVTVAPGLEQLRALAWEARLVASEGHYPRFQLGEHLLRFDLYAATAGCVEARLRVAVGVAALTYQRNLMSPERASLLSAALGWLLIVAEPAEHVGPGRQPSRERAAEAAALAVQRLVEAYGPPVDEEVASLDSIPNGRRPRRVVPIQEVPAAGLHPASDTPDTGIVVLREIGAPDTEDGRRIADRWAELVGARLPVIEAPTDLDRVFIDLVAQFPHAASVAAALRSDLAGRRDLVFRPTILVGEPGCGKTSFLQALLVALGLPHEITPCAASYHHSLVGTDRHWNSSAPSLPMRLIYRHGTASVAVVLDELEKSAAGSGRQGRGNTFDALLPLLEDSTAAAYLDKFFQAKCDLSRVTWLGTANDLEGIPPPLRDRCRILRFPEPGVEHLPVLAKNLLRDAVAARGLDPSWALPLDGLELEALQAAWSGGSLRILGRLVGAVLDARDFCPPNEVN